MLADRPKEQTKPNTKRASIRDVYREMLHEPDLSDKAIDELRQHVVRLAQTLCEHVWGKRFY